jgi:hypothetical protein
MRDRFGIRPDVFQLAGKNSSFGKRTLIGTLAAFESTLSIGG